MPILSPKLEIPLSSPDLPAPIMFRSAHVPADGLYPQHQHAWGEFVYSFSGVMEVKLADHHYLAPPQYGVWLPPEVTHIGLNRHEAHHCSVYMTPQACQGLPRNACALTVSPLVRALLDHLRQQPRPNPACPHPSRTRGPPDAGAGRPAGPSSLRRQLPAQLGRPGPGALLRALEADPGDNRSLAELAHTVHTTERTLMRRCQRDLGMSLTEWRQRLRVVKALPLLEAGHKVETIALDLGYGSASAFIAMFRRLMGVTPDEYRRGTSRG